MNPIIEEWLRKAEGDWHTANRELRVRKNPNYDAACFHAEQCAEKYLQAYLLSVGLRFPKSHDLLKLMELGFKDESSFELQRDILTQLNRYSVLDQISGRRS